MNRYVILAFWLLAGILPAAAQTTLPDAIKDESSVTYTLVHLFHTVEGKSKNVNYRVEIDPVQKEIKSVTAQADVTTFDSGNSNRDSHAMEVIDAITYPDVTFSSTSVSRQGDDLTVAGKLTFHGITNDITATGTSKWSPGKLEFQGAFALSLTAFKVERPSLLMIPVDDTLHFSLKAAFELK